MVTGNGQERTEWRMRVTLNGQHWCECVCISPNGQIKQECSGLDGCVVRAATRRNTALRRQRQLTIRQTCHKCVQSTKPPSLHKGSCAHRHTSSISDASRPECTWQMEKRHKFRSWAQASRGDAYSDTVHNEHPHTIATRPSYTDSPVGEVLRLDVGVKATRRE